MRDGRRGRGRRDRPLFLALVSLSAPLALLICARSGLFTRPQNKRWLYHFQSVEFDRRHGWMAAAFEGQRGSPATEYRTFAAVRYRPDSDSLDPSRAVCVLEGRHSLRFAWDGDRRLRIICPDCTEADALRADARWGDGRSADVRLVYAFAPGRGPSPAPGARP